MAKGDISAKLVDYVVSYTRSEGSAQIDGMVAVWMEGPSGRKNTVESVTVSQVIPMAEFKLKTVAELEDILKAQAEQRSDLVKELPANPDGKKVE